MAIQRIVHEFSFNGVTPPDYVYRGLWFEPVLPRTTGEVSASRLPILAPELPAMRLRYDRLSYNAWQWWYQWTGDLNGGVQIANVMLPFPTGNPVGARPFHVTFAKGVLYQIELMVGGWAQLYTATRNIREHWHEGQAQIRIKELAINGDEW